MEAQPKRSQIAPNSWGWGRPHPKVESLDWDNFPWKVLYATILFPPLYLAWKCSSAGYIFLYWFVVPLLLLLLILPCFVLLIVSYSYLLDTCNTQPLNIDSYIEFKDEAFATTWRGRRIPIEALYEAYFAGQVDMKGDLLTTLYKRQQYATFTLTMNHVKFFCFQFLPELIVHSEKQDSDQVTDHYDRGNDFYNSFLGPMMVYTSGIFHGRAEETLEEAQVNKLNLICRKIQLKEGENMLDIGCGWGTLACHAAKHFGANTLGVTLAKEQKKWADGVIERDEIKTARIEVLDYRNIPKERKFDKITCVEMAEHVGVRRFQTFLRQVKDMLEDDGIFFLQIAGLRRSWQYEDLVWGLFMGKYVFPGADASCPLGWVVNQLEEAGFECSSIDNIGIHYSATIKRWYDNWVSNKALIEERYSNKWYRTWLWFLAWAVIAAEQGSATCYQIVTHKNTVHWDRKRLITERHNVWTL